MNEHTDARDHSRIIESLFDKLNYYKQNIQIGLILNDIPSSIMNLPYSLAADSIQPKLLTISSSLSCCQH